MQRSAYREYRSHLARRRCGRITISAQPGRRYPVVLWDHPLGYDSFNINVKVGEERNFWSDLKYSWGSPREQVRKIDEVLFRKRHSCRSNFPKFRRTFSRGLRIQHRSGFRRLRSLGSRQNGLMRRQASEGAMERMQKKEANSGVDNLRLHFDVQRHCTIPLVARKRYSQNH
jgi:hypothetical protein